jgi:hypothetical protein
MRRAIVERFARRFVFVEGGEVLRREWDTIAANS